MVSAVLLADVLVRCDPAPVLKFVRALSYRDVAAEACLAAHEAGLTDRPSSGSDRGQAEDELREVQDTPKMRLSRKQKDTSNDDPPIC